MYINTFKYTPKDVSCQLCKANGYIPVCAEPYGRCAMTSFQVRRTGPL